MISLSPSELPGTSAKSKNGFNLDGYCLCESREGRVDIRAFIAAHSYSLEGFSFSSSLLDDLIKDR
jgi:hypothetical protein